MIRIPNLQKWTQQLEFSSGCQITVKIVYRNAVGFFLGKIASLLKKKCKHCNSIDFLSVFFASIARKSFNNHHIRVLQKNMPNMGRHFYCSKAVKFVQFVLFAKGLSYSGLYRVTQQILYSIQNLIKGCNLIWHPVILNYENGNIILTCPHP